MQGTRSILFGTVISKSYLILHTVAALVKQSVYYNCMRVFTSYQT
jgi:hypothetical protein